jgi:tetratricopeptide (TPR) repeat protein
MISRILLQLVFLLVPAIASASSISDLRAAVAKENFREINRLAFEVFRQHRIDLSSEARRQMAIENNQLIKQPTTTATLLKLIDELEASVEQRDKELSHRKAAQITLFAMRLEQTNGPDPMIAFNTAKNQAAADPSFTNFYALALRANVAKQYAASIEAANKALQRRSSDLLASMTPEGAHAVANIAANASFELGNMPEAERYLLESLNSGGQRWVRMCPDWYVAEKMLNAGRREAVTQYFENAYKLPFPKCQESISLWISELKSGKTPRFTPPPKN